MSDLSAVKALVFDVFGTVVDWRGSLIMVHLASQRRYHGCFEGDGLGMNMNRSPRISATAIAD